MASPLSVSAIMLEREAVAYLERYRLRHIAVGRY